MTLSLTLGSLYTGTGGLDLAVAATLNQPIDTLFTCDIDPAVHQIEAHRFPCAAPLGDITDVDWSTVPRVDILTGSSPCQSVSPAGHRQGFTPTSTSGRWSSMARAIATLHPRLVFWENVPGIATAPAHGASHTPCPSCATSSTPSTRMRALGRVVADLCDIGYDTAWGSLSAASVGACHPRSRLWLVAWPHDTTLPPITTTPTTPTAPDTAPMGPPRRGLVISWDREADMWTCAHRRCRNGHPAPYTGAFPKTGACLQGRAWRMPLLCGLPQVVNRARPLLPTPRASDGPKGGPNQVGFHGGMTLSTAVAHIPTPVRVSRCDAGGHCQAWGVYAEAVHHHELAFAQPAPQPTGPTGRDGGPRLSVQAAEWMMGLPAGWLHDPGLWIPTPSHPGAWSPAARRRASLHLAGNAVIPRQGAAAFTELLTRQASLRNP